MAVSIPNSIANGLPADGDDVMENFLALKAYVDAIPIQSESGNGRFVGEIIEMASDAQPPGTLECLGQAVSRTQYDALFAAIGTKFGAGNGSTTFNLPPPGVVFVGRSAVDADFDTVGETGGAKTVTLTTAQIPLHSHPATTTMTTAGAHGHNSNDLPYASTATLASGTAKRERTSVSSTSGWNIIANGGHVHPVTTTVSNQSEGGGAHQNMPPYVVVRRWIVF
jgi:microcystin-dependent protein